MDQKLVEKLNEHFQSIAIELSKYFEQEDFKIGYFNDSNQKDSPIYFRRDDLLLCTLNVENLFYPMMDI